jgi:hypothetical protein
MGMGGGGVLKIVVIARDREEQNSPLIDTDDTDDTDRKESGNQNRSDRNRVIGKISETYANLG